MCHKTGFYHVLFVSVVPLVSVESVESVMESNDVLMTCFCVVSLSGTMRFAMSVLLEETAFGGHASLQHADPSNADFLEHLMAACPRSVIHASQKCPQFCGIGSSWMLNKLFFELVPQKEFQGRKGLESKAVQIRLCRGSAHASLEAMSRSNKILHPRSLRALQLGAVYSSITLSGQAPRSATSAQCQKRP